MKKLELGSDPLVWWLSERDIKMIGEPEDGEYIDMPWPEYVKQGYGECVSWVRGNGRLAFHSLVQETRVTIPEHHFNTDRPLVKAILESGGIAMRPADGLYVSGYPGFITDLELNIWTPKTFKR